jgi:hypothetical protein
VKSGNQRDSSNYSSYGNVGSGQTMKPVVTDSIQTINSLKPTEFYYTNHGNTNINNNEMHVSIAKLEQDRINNRQWVPSAMPQLPSNKEMIGQTYLPLEEVSVINERISPDLLTAFKENPYTPSLSSY